MASTYTEIGGGGAPSGAAGGDLTGSTYPNPVLSAASSASAIPVTTAFSFGASTPSTGAIRLGTSKYVKGKYGGFDIHIAGVDPSGIIYFGEYNVAANTVMDFYTGSTSAQGFRGYIGANVAFQFHPTIADTETAMLVRVNRSGVYSLDRVTIGAADSGGAGYKALRVPN